MDAEWRRRGNKDGKPQARMEKALADLLAALKR